MASARAKRWGTGRLTTKDMESIVVGDFYSRGAPRQEEPFVWRWRDGLYDVEKSLSVIALDDRLECEYGHHARGEVLRTAVMSVPVSWSPCNLGGRRASLHCLSCDRGVRILYLNPASLSLVCRTCADLRYESQSQSRRERAALRARLAREQFGAGTRFGSQFPPKPKGMHWKTYDRLCAELRLAERAYLNEVASEETMIELAVARLAARVRQS